MYLASRRLIQSNEYHKFVAFYLKSVFQTCKYFLISRYGCLLFPCPYFALSNMTLCLRNDFIVFIFHMSHLGEERTLMELLFICVIALCKGVSLHGKSSSALLLWNQDIFVLNEWLKYLPTQYLVTVFSLNAYFCAWTFSIFGCKEKGKYKAHEGWFSALFVFPASSVSQDPCLK